MKVSSVRLAMLVLLSALPASAVEPSFSPAVRDGVPDSYIVILEDNVVRTPADVKSSLPRVPEVAQNLGQRYGGQVERIWENVLQGFTIRMPAARAQELAGDGAVAKVIQDVYVKDPFLSAAPPDCYYPSPSYVVDTRPLPLFSPQSLSCTNPDPQSGTTCLDNWGIDRIDQASVARNNSYSYANRGIGVHVYVLDTGVRATHREFYDRRNVSRVSGGVNTTVPAGNPARFDTSDCYGHGTHVTAILAGRTYGVAKDAIIHPVRVITCPGTSPPVQNWIDGLDWIVGNHAANANAEGTAVVSWSGGNDWNWVNATAPIYQTLRTAVRNLAAVSTLLLVQAAGNQSSSTSLLDACSYSFGDETRYSGSDYVAVARIFVAGGSDENDERWTRRAGDPGYSNYCGSDCGSNIGRCLDMFSPAAHVVSASHLHDAGYCRLSGTSMAAPHVSGVAAHYLQRHRRDTSDQVKAQILSAGTAGALQTNPSDPNYIGANSPNLLLRANMPVGTCGVDRNFTTAKNTRLTFYASTLRGTGCLAGDGAYSNFDLQYGTLSIGGIGPTDILYYYDPPTGFSGVDSFTYNLYNSPGLIKAMGLVKVTVTP